MPLRRTLVATLGLLLTTVLGLAPLGGQANAESSQQSTTLRGVITFNKNWANPQRSRLVWRVWRHHDGRRTLVEQQAWRAGSGFTHDSTNASATGLGCTPTTGAT
jgi:hypothetical protein